MQGILKRLLCIILVLIMLPFTNVSAASNSKTWGYYTFSFPDGYSCDDYSGSNLYATGDSSEFIIQLVDLSTMGLPASTDVLGEELVLETLLATSVEAMGTASLFDKGTIDGAAYEIDTVQVNNNGSTFNMTVFGLLKKNMMILAMLSDKTLQHGKLVATEFIQNMTIYEDLQTDDSYVVKWEIQSINDNVVTLFNENRTCVVSIPDNYQIYVPGEGENSPIPKFLGYTLEEMEQFISQLRGAKMYVYALDMDVPAEIYVSLSDENGKLAVADASGKFSEEEIKAYYDGTATSQGDYEKIKIGDINYYVFPNYSNGYKVRCFIGTIEVSVRIKTIDNTYSLQQKQDALSIAQSVIIE